MNRAAKGRRNEHRTMSFLEDQHYYTVRSAGSHGAIDVVGVYMGYNPGVSPILKLIQCKTGGSYSETGLFNLRVIINQIMENTKKITDELSKHVDPVIASEIVTYMSPQFELHDWEKFRQKPTITILGAEKGSDITIYD